MLSDRVCFIVMPMANASIQLGIAEPAGIGVTNSPVFDNQTALKMALEDVGLPGNLAFVVGLSSPRHVTFLQLVSLGFF